MKSVKDQGECRPYIFLDHTPSNTACCFVNHMKTRPNILFHVADLPITLETMSSLNCLSQDTKTSSSYHFKTSSLQDHIIPITASTSLKWFLNFFCPSFLSISSLSLKKKNKRANIKVLKHSPFKISFVGLSQCELKIINIMEKTLSKNCQGLLKNLSIYPDFELQRQKPLHFKRYYFLKIF